MDLSSFIRIQPIDAILNAMKVLIMIKSKKIINIIKFLRIRLVLLRPATREGLFSEVITSLHFLPQDTNEIIKTRKG